MGLTFLSVPSPGFKEIERHPSKKVKQHILVRLWSALVSFFRQLVLQILAAGPLPRHVAIIMDGNRRYAERQHIERHIGHLYGYDRLIDTLEVFMELGVQVLTVYAFSIDNFKRPEEEVSSLMQLLHNKLVSLGEDQSLVKAYGIKVCILGDLSLLPEAVRGAAKRTMDVTRENKGPVFNLCISYTAREEMTSAVEKARDLILTEAELADERTEKHLRGSGLADGHELERRSPRAAAVGGGEGIIERHLYTAGCPPVDLLIRTSGETRLSNFMLWQSSDALLSFYSVLWPDFSFRHMMWAILDYQRAWPHLQRFQSSSSSASCNMLNSNVDPS
eukprot:jgi/Mesen1/8795/ME000528S08192